jgi:hypothetical protein
MKSLPQAVPIFSMNGGLIDRSPAAVAYPGKLLKTIQ